MNIYLETSSIWTPVDECAEERFFRALGKLLQPEDILVVGSYEPGDEGYAWLCSNSFDVQLPKGYHDCWDANRVEYPRGRTYCFHPTPDILAGLEAIRATYAQAASAAGGNNLEVYLDHIAAFRAGQPAAPLLDFHDAFYGGALTLSGLYAKQELAEFEEALGVKMKRAWHPAIHGCLRDGIQDRQFE